MAKQAKNKIRIRLKAYDQRLLDRATSDIVETAKRTGARVVGHIPLPTRREIYTVLRSSNIDRKSREQFETKHYQKFITIYYDNNSENDIENIDFIVHFIK